MVRDREIVAPAHVARMNKYWLILFYHSGLKIRLLGVERRIKAADFLLNLMLILLASAASLGNGSPSQTPRFSRLQSDEASYRVFLLAVTLLLKAEFTSLGAAAS